MGGNLAVAMPQPQRTFEAMKKLDMQVHIATKLNRSHLLLAKHNYLLPALGRTERDMQATGIQSVTVEDSMSMVHASCGGLKPASQWLKSEPAIVAGLARATLPHSPVNWEALTGNYALIRDAIEAVIPAFRDYNARIVELADFVWIRRLRGVNGIPRTVKPILSSAASMQSSGKNSLLRRWCWPHCVATISTTLLFMV